MGVLIIVKSPHVNNLPLKYQWAMACNSLILGLQSVLPFEGSGSKPSDLYYILTYYMARINDVIKQDNMYSVSIGGRSS